MATVQNWLGKALVIGVLVAEFVLFRQYALREVTWSYPPNHDQLHFLDWSYKSSLRMKDHLRDALGQAAGFHNSPAIPPKPGVVEIPPPRMERGLEEAPSSSELMFTLQGAILFRLLGAGRLTALSLNFFYFALFQWVLVATIRWVTGRWSVALIALGLLLAAGTPFQGAGGLFDFRMDFSTFCLYGIFICAVIRSGIFSDWRWSIVAGLAGVLLFTFRFFTILYLGGALGLLVVFFILRRWRKTGPQRKQLNRQIVNTLIASAIILVVSVPIIVQRFDALKAYYGVGHITGKEKKIRALAEGIKTTRDALIFYPSSLYGYHAGPTMVFAAKWLLAAATVLLVVRLLLQLLFTKLKKRQALRPLPEGEGTGRARRGASAFDVWGAVFFLIATFLVPLLLLTSDESKSSVVADILVGPTILIIVMAIAILAGTMRRSTPLLVVRLALVAMCGFALFEGAEFAHGQYVRVVKSPHDREEIEKLLRLYDRMGSICTVMGWVAPETGFDSNWDALNFMAFSVMAFERGHREIHPNEVLANSIFARSPAEEKERLSRADLTLLSEFPAPPPGQFEFDFDKQIRELKPKFFEWCRQNCVELERIHFDSPAVFDATLFIRPSVRIDGESDGWMANYGTQITGLAEVLRSRPEIELIGKNAADRLPRPPHVTAALVAPGLAPIPVPAELKYDGPNYRLNIHVDPALLAEHGKVVMILSFDSSFTLPGPPGTEEREVVLRLPESGEVRRREPAATQPVPLDRLEK